MSHKLDILEVVLVTALVIALICSIVICYQVYVLKNNHYKQLFSTWQMPMIFAILADLYFMR
jgi:Na+-transporting NADH:ubiquinone oxidoreductase subunit NqrC